MNDCMINNAVSIMTKYKLPNIVNRQECHLPLNHRTQSTCMSTELEAILWHTIQEHALLVYVTIVLGLTWPVV